MKSIKNAQAIEAALPQTSKKPSASWKRFIQQWEVQVMIIPGLLFLLVFSYFPMYGVLIAFQDYNLFKGLFHSPWVGFKHFEMFFRSPDFFTVLRNTISISMLKLLIGFPAPIILAVMLNEAGNIAFKRIVQTITYLPHFLSWVIVGGFVISMLSVDNGSVNMLLERLNLISSPVNWLSIPEYFWTILISSNVWKDIGFSSIVYLAAIAGIDPHLHEAAAMDGAGRLRQTLYIVLPCIMPVILVFLILNIGNMLNAGFEDILMLTNNGHNGILWKVSDVIDTYVYRVGLQNQRYSYAAAVGLFKAVLSVGLLVAANRMSRRFGYSLWWREEDARHETQPRR